MTLVIPLSIIYSIIHSSVCLLELWTLRFRIVKLHWVKHVLRSKAQIKKKKKIF